MIKRKDILTPDPLWNQTSQRHLHLPEKVAVLEVNTDFPSQTGIMISVQTLSGILLELDSGWFLETRTKKKTKNEEFEQIDFFEPTQSELWNSL